MRRFTSLSFNSLDSGRSDEGKGGWAIVCCCSVVDDDDDDDEDGDGDDDEEEEEDFISFGLVEVKTNSSVWNQLLE